MAEPVGPTDDAATGPTSPTPMRYDAVIFDVDGVLVEPTDPVVHREAVRAALAGFGVEAVDAETVERLVEITGDDRDQLSADSVEQVCRRHGIDPGTFWAERERRAAEAQVEEVEAGRKALYPDAAVVEELHGRGVSLAAISNNQAQLVTAMFEAYGLADQFDATYGREPTLQGLRRRKPDPYYANQAMTALDAADPLLVGDSEVDVETARRLDIDSVFVRRDHRQDYELTTPAAHEIESLRELPGLLEG